MPLSFPPVFLDSCNESFPNHDTQAATPHLSTTHASSSAIMGMGLRKDGNGVNHAMVGQIALAWLVTPPTASVIGIAAYWVLSQASKVQ